jgi:hypothetical protein
MRETELAAIALRAEQTTPGPWTFNGICAVWQESTHVFLAKTSPTYSTTSHASKTQQEYNGAFIAHARQDVPVLLQYVRELQGQVADLWDESRAYELGRMAERGKVLKILRESADFWEAIREVKTLGPFRPLPHPEQLAAENALLHAALYRLRNRLGDVPWLTEQDGELMEALKQAIAALNGAKE